MNASIVVDLIAVLATFVGLWLLHSVRRRMALEMAETRRTAYSKLWQLTGLATPARADVTGTGGALTLTERVALWEALTNWYYEDGNGMLLEAVSKKVYLHAKHNLVCPTVQLRPEGLAELLSGSSDDPSDKRLGDTARGDLSIRQLSLLRTQLKSDLRIYGQVYSRRLSTDEIFFLEGSTVDLSAKAWASSLGRPPKRWHSALSRITQARRGGEASIVDTTDRAPWDQSEDFPKHLLSAEAPRLSVDAVARATRRPEEGAIGGSLGAD